MRNAKNAARKHTLSEETKSTNLNEACPYYRAKRIINTVFDIIDP